MTRRFGLPRAVSSFVVVLAVGAVALSVAYLVDHGRDDASSFVELTKAEERANPPLIEDSTSGRVSLSESDVSNPARQTNSKRARAWLTARLVDSQQEPLVGLVVTGHMVPRSREWGISPEIDTTTQLGESTSDADGIVKLSMRSDGALQLRLSDQEYGFGDVRPRFAYAGRDLDAGDLECRKTLRLSGRVVDEEGVAIAGAYVRAICARIVFDTKTRPDGRFDLQHLPVEASVVVADAVGYTPERVVDPTSEDGTIIRLRRAALRAVLVVDDRGRPVESARITTPRSSQRTKLAPRVEGAVGQFLVECDVQRGTTFEVTAPQHESLTVSMAAGSEAVTVKLNRCASIAGILVTPEGTPIPHRTLLRQSLRSKSSGRAAAFIARLADPRALVSTDKGGRFAFDCVPSGKTLFLADQFVVKVRANDGSEIAQYDVEPAARVLGLKLLSHAMRSVLVRTESASGEPLAGAEVMLAGAVIKTDENGECRIFVPAPIGAAGAQEQSRAMRIRVDATGYGRYDEWHALPEAKPRGEACVVRLERAAGVELRAFGRNGKALRFARIYGYRDGAVTADVTGATEVFEVDSLGHAYARQLRPGAWRFRLVQQGGGFEASPFSSAMSMGLASSEVQAALVSGRSTRVTIRDRAGPTLRVGFRWHGALQKHGWVRLRADSGGESELKSTFTTGFASFARRSQGEHGAMFRPQDLPFEWHRRLTVTRAPSVQTRTFDIDGAKLVIAVSGKRPTVGSLVIRRGTEIKRLDLTKSQRFVIEPLPPGEYRLASKEFGISTLDGSKTSFVVRGREHIEKHLILR